MSNVSETLDKINTPFAVWLAKFESRFSEDRRRAAIAACGTPSAQWTNKQRNVIVRWLKEDKAKGATPEPKSAEIDGRFIATRFVERLTGSATTVMRLRFIHDSDRTNRTLERQGTIAQLWPDILEFQKEGYGCFYFLNETKSGSGSGKDGCATDDDVTQIRALAIDSDNKGRPDSWHVQPSAIVCTSKVNDVQKVHGLWPVVDLPVDKFALAQQRLAAHYGSDTSISNPSRVLRLPGTWHLKVTSKPQLVTFEDHSEGGELWEYVKDAEDVLAGLPDLPAPSPKSAVSGTPVSVEHVRTLLGYIDAGMGRDDWLKIVAGIHATNLGDGDVSTARGLAVTWSRGELDCSDRYKDARPPTYTNDDDVEQAFETMPPKEGGASYGTLFHYGEAAGYRGGPYRGNGSDTFGKQEQGKRGKDKDGWMASGALRYRSLADVTPRNIVWLWPNRIAAGKLTLIAGAPDDGKSQICVNIVATISNGGSWPLSEGKTEKAASIWLTAEDSSEDTITPRMMAAGANRDLVFELKATAHVEDSSRTLNIVDDLKDIAAMIEQIKADHGVPVKTIIIDPISAYMGGRGKGDTWKNSDVRNIMTPLLEFIERTGISVIGITHFNKSNNANVLNRVIDSIALPALSRATWLTAVETNDDGQKTGRRLFLTGRSAVGEPVPGLAYRIVGATVDDGTGTMVKTSRVEWTGHVTATATEALGEQAGRIAGKLEAAEDFLRAMLIKGPADVKDIMIAADKKKHSWATIRRAKDKLGIIAAPEGFGRNKTSLWAFPENTGPDDQGPELGPNSFETGLG